MTGRAFWIAVAERAAKTFAQTLAAALTAGGIGIVHAGLLAVLATAGLAAVLSVLTSVGSVNFGPGGTPSLVVEPSTTDPATISGILADQAARRSTGTVPPIRPTSTGGTS